MPLHSLLGDAGTATIAFTFAGDVEAKGGGTIAIKVGKAGQNESATFILQGNVTETNGAITIVAGAGTDESNDAADITIDSKSNENYMAALEQLMLKSAFKEVFSSSVRC